MEKIEFQQMSRESKLRLMHELWDDLAADDSSVDSPSWHADALRDTKERVDAGTEHSHDWEEAKEKLRRRAE